MLFTQKTSFINSHFLNWLVVRYGINNIHWENIMMDNEQAMITSLHENIPQLNVRSCFFHFGQAILTTRTIYSMYVRVSAVVPWEFRSLGCPLLPNCSTRLVAICCALSRVEWVKRLRCQAGSPIPILPTPRVYEYDESVVADDC